MILAIRSCLSCAHFGGKSVTKLVWYGWYEPDDFYAADLTGLAARLRSYTRDRTPDDWDSAASDRAARLPLGLAHPPAIPPEGRGFARSGHRGWCRNRSRTGLGQRDRPSRSLATARGHPCLSSSPSVWPLLRRSPSVTLLGPGARAPVLLRTRLPFDANQPVSRIDSQGEPQQPGALIGERTLAALGHDKSLCDEQLHQVSYGVS
jgi:hypothetical protein